MRESLSAGAQIIGILKQAEAARMATDLCRGHGLTQATLYRWHSKYGGIEVSDTQ
jgi:putative transposase